MKSKLLALLLAVIMLTGVVGLTAGAEAAAAKDPAVELIFTSVSTTGEPHSIAMQIFADKVKELSGGSVTCKVYTDGTLFASANELDALLTGSAAGGADLAYLSFPTLATQDGLKWLSMIGSGYFWKNFDMMNGVLNGDIGRQYIWNAVEEKMNLHAFGAFYLGSRVVNTTKKEVNSYADMSGILLRMPNSDTWLRLGTALGANPTPLSFSELYTALQAGTVEGQDNPISTVKASSFFEVTKYVAVTNHVVDSILPMMNKGTWDSMTAAQQQAVTDAIAFAREANNVDRIARESDTVSFLEEKGLKVTYPNIDEFRTNVQAVYAAHPDWTADWNMDIYNLIQAEAVKY
jgi:TRAP-type transport system periplasmic protein